MGRKGPRAKTKTVLKPVNKKQLGCMPKMKKDKNPNKNHPIATVITPGGDAVATVVMAATDITAANQQQQMRQQD